MGLRDHKGITLVEIIVSIAILGIIVTPLSSLFVTTVRNNSMARDKMIANQLAQKFMEDVMLDVKKGGRISVGEQTLDDGKFMITTNIDRKNKYGLGNSSGNIVVNNYDKSLDLSDFIKISNNDKLDLIISSGQILLKEEEELIVSCSYGTSPHKDINIRLECNSNLQGVNIDVSNESDRTVNIYKVYGELGNDEIEINTKLGEVYSYNNIFDDSVKEDNKYVFKIIITVKKNGEELAKLASYKTND